MNTTLHLQKDDINTSIMGHHVQIKTDGDGPTINLTKEAAIELLADLEALRDDGHLDEEAK